MVSAYLQFNSSVTDSIKPAHAPDAELQLRGQHAKALCSLAT